VQKRIKRPGAMVNIMAVRLNEGGIFIGVELLHEKTSCTLDYTQLGCPCKYQDFNYTQRILHGQLFSAHIRYSRNFSKIAIVCHTDIENHLKLPST